MSNTQKSPHGEIATRCTELESQIMQLVVRFEESTGMHVAHAEFVYSDGGEPYRIEDTVLGDTNRKFKSGTPIRPSYCRCRVTVDPTQTED